MQEYSITNMESLNQYLLKGLHKYLHQYKIMECKYR